MTLTPRRPNNGDLSGAPPYLDNTQPDLPYSSALYFAVINSLMGLFFPESASAKTYFDPISLERKGNGQIENDLRHFSLEEGQLAGDYFVDIYLNDRLVDTRPVTFVDQDGALYPLFTVDSLQAMGVNIEAIAALSSLPKEQTFSGLASVIPDATTVFDFNQQRLLVSIPQAALNIEARSSVDPALWDQGLTSALLNYSYSGARSSYSQSEKGSNNHFLNLRSALNVGAWRLRNYATYAENARNQSRWQSISSYAQHDVQALRGQLTLGDSITSGIIFESVGFRGIQLASDDNMLPDSLRGFAPVIRGIANSNALVMVRQNGYVIYQAFVAPGAFTISDLYPTAASGDLEVIIREADGTERLSLQPYAATPIMQREGQLKYSVTAGRYRSSSPHGNTPPFLQSSVIYGLPFANTAYGGVQGGESYQAVLLGLGHGFGDFGALSVDITHARSRLGDESVHRGHAYRLQYSKSIATTGTTLTLAGYRYSSAFYDMKEINEFDASKGNSWPLRYAKRSKAKLTITQSLGAYGNLYSAASQQEYRQRVSKQRSLTLGYNLNYRGISYGLDYVSTQVRRTDSGDRQLSFSIAIPLDAFMAGSWMRYRVARNKNSGTLHSTSLNGTALADHNLSYQLQQTYDSEGQGYGGNTGGTYKGSYGELSVGYSYDRNLRQINYGAQGSIVAHPYGITLAQPAGDTAVLVRIPGASGVKIENNTGVRTDWRGYTVVPYGSAYRHNRIALDTNSYAEDIDVDAAATSVVPTQGALVLADFKTRIGHRVLITLMRKTGPVPFGATASLVNPQSSSGIVGDGGQVYLSGIPDSGTLEVKWGSAASQGCRADFSLPRSDAQNSGVKMLSAICK